MTHATLNPILAATFPNLVKMGWIQVRPCFYSFNQLRRMKLHADKNKKRRAAK